MLLDLKEFYQNFYQHHVDNLLKTLVARISKPVLLS